MKRYLFFLIIAASLSFAAPIATFAQCAMCRATVESNVTSKESKVGSGLNSGILYLMAIPYILVGTVGFFWYRQSQQHKKKQQAGF